MTRILGNSFAGAISEARQNTLIVGNREFPPTKRQVLVGAISEARQNTLIVAQFIAKSTAKYAYGIWRLGHSVGATSWSRHLVRGVCPPAEYQKRIQR